MPSSLLECGERRIVFEALSECGPTLGFEVVVPQSGGSERVHNRVAHFGGAGVRGGVRGGGDLSEVTVLVFRASDRLRMPSTTYVPSYLPPPMYFMPQSSLLAKLQGMRRVNWGS